MLKDKNDYHFCKFLKMKVDKKTWSVNFFTIIKSCPLSQGEKGQFKSMETGKTLTASAQRMGSGPDRGDGFSLS
jgi:hypothetical protein